MKKHYFAPVYGPRHELVRYAGVVVEATGPEGGHRQKPGDKTVLKPLETGGNAAFEAICATLAEGERVLKRTVRSLG